MNIHDFVDALMVLRGTYPISCGSWFRTSQRNADVKGVARSYHRSGLAVDVYFDRGYELDKALFKHDCWKAGIEAIEYSDHWHLERAG